MQGLLSLKKKNVAINTFSIQVVVVTRHNRRYLKHLTINNLFSTVKPPLRFDCTWWGWTNRSKLFSSCCSATTRLQRMFARIVPQSAFIQIYKISLKLLLVHFLHTLFHRNKLREREGLRTAVLHFFFFSFPALFEQNFLSNCNSSRFSLGRFKSTKHLCKPQAQPQSLGTEKFLFEIFLPNCCCCCIDIFWHIIWQVDFANYIWIFRQLWCSFAILEGFLGWMGERFPSATKGLDRCPRWRGESRVKLHLLQVLARGAPLGSEKNTNCNNTEFSFPSVELCSLLKIVWT